MPSHCYNAKAGGDSHPVGTSVFEDIIKYQWTVDYNMYPLNMRSAIGATFHNFN